LEASPYVFNILPTTPDDDKTQEIFMIIYKQKTHSGGKEE